MRRGGVPLSFPPFTTAVKWIVIASGVMFLLQVIAAAMSPGFAAVLAGLALVPGSVTHGWVWQLFTYSFLHQGLLHLLFNMLAVWMFGSQFEMAWGGRRFLEMFYFSVIGAALVAVGVAYLPVPAVTNFLHIAPNAVIIGSQGGVYGLLVAFGIIYAEQEIFLMLPPVNIKAKYFVIGLIFIDVVVTFMGSGATTLIDLSGLLFGYLYVKHVPRFGILTGASESYFGVINRYHRWKRRRAARKFQVYMRKHDPKDYFDEYGNFRDPETKSDDSKDEPPKWVN
jgi:membrane associated rhomboid family serine protease